MMASICRASVADVATATRTCTNVALSVGDEAAREIANFSLPPSCTLRRSASVEPTTTPP